MRAIRSPIDALLGLGGDRLAAAVLAPLGPVGELASSRWMRASLAAMIADVDQEQDDEDDVGRGDVLAGLVERERGHQAAACRAPGDRAPAGAGRVPSSARRRREARRGALRRQLEADERRPEQRDPGEADEEGEHISPGSPPVDGGEGPRMDERLGEADGDEVERHEGAGGDREDRGVAGLALAVRDRVAQRVVGAVEEEDDQEADQRRLAATPTRRPTSAFAQIAPVTSTATPKITEMWIET